LFTKKKATPALNTKAESQQQNPAANNPAIAGQTIDGVLKSSDNKRLGNLMLVTTSKKIYIFTNRDFSDLINKDVAVTYQGTLDNFRLGDIVGK
jgi:hypothetical protein